MDRVEKHLPQNIYDNPRFYEGYKELRQNDTGLNGPLEVPALQAQLPNLSGLAVLDLGCGFGDFARYARHAGAASVTALDVSEKMIAEAIRLTTDEQIHYQLGSIEAYTPESQAYDLVVSSMALHYVADYAAAVRKMFEALKRNGQFIFSVEHPICTAHPAGWVQDESGTCIHWPVDRYQMEGERKTSWFVNDVMKYHRTVETYINTLLATGFRINHVGEPRPLPEYLAVRPSLEETLRRPPVLLLAASKT